MAGMEEDRQQRLVEQQRQRQRDAARKQRKKEESERKALAAKPRVDMKQVSVKVNGCEPASTAFHSDLRVLTWNAMDDAHADDYPAETRSCHRALHLAKAICEQEPHIV